MPEPPPGAIFSVEALEPSPESLILDEARLFDENDYARLSARLQDFKSAHGIEIYVVAYSVLIGETIDSRAKLLREKWLAGEPGIVVGYQRGNERMTFSSTAEPLDDILKSELEFLFSRAYEAAAMQSNASGRVIAAVDLLLTELPKSFARQRDSKFIAATEARSFVAWSLGLMVLLAIAGMLAFQFMRRAQVQVSRSYTFPALKAAERFGAPYSGGCQAEAQFTVRSE